MIKGIPLLAFIDDDYRDDNFFNGRYSFGAVADLDKMMFVYDFFSDNWDGNGIDYFGAVASNVEVVHHFHQTDSQIYDYTGEEKYDASYIMADIDLGPKVNVVTELEGRPMRPFIIPMSPPIMLYQIGFILVNLFHNITCLHSF